jgi:hypothetical protein
MPHRSQTQSTHSLAGAQGLVEIEPWDGNTDYVSEAFAETSKSKRRESTPRAENLALAK